MKTYFSFFSIILLLACQNSATIQNNFVGIEVKASENIHSNPIDTSVFDRGTIISKLKEKVKRKEPLLVHCLVPLCDNENQGIVPTSKSLGDGFSVRTNLYWATSNGMKKYFQKSGDWKTIEIKDSVNENVLERAVFERSFSNGARVILVCDAYRGDKMKACLTDYFEELAMLKLDSIKVAGKTISKNYFDLVAFNGHNGLMDVEIPIIKTNHSRKKDAVAIGCISNEYFIPYFHNQNAYPLVTTTGLMYPGAFVLDGILDEWSNFKSEKDCQVAAGKAYNRVKKCGERAGINLFQSGW